MTDTRERELAEALRKSELDGEAEARSRTLSTVREAFGEREPRSRGRRWTAAGIAAVSLAVVGVIGLTPAGADFRQWVQDTVDPQAPRPRPQLTTLTGGGSLLAESKSGATIVHPDGSRRVLDGASAASWSPHGRNIALASGGTLAAVNAAGVGQWSFSLPGKVRFPAWSQDRGYRVAYLSNDTLRLVAGDGTGDHLLGPAADVGPAWRGQTDRVLAFADEQGSIRLIDVDRNETLGRIDAPDRLTAMSFSADGERLLAFSPRNLQVSDPDTGEITRWRGDAGTEITSATFLGDGDRVALLQTRREADGSTASTVSIFEPGPGATDPRVIFRTSGRLRGLALSPAGNWLVTGWKDGDQWLFLEPKPDGNVRSFGNVSAQLAAGVAKPPFPTPADWCCGE